MFIFTVETSPFVRYLHKGNMRIEYLDLICCGLLCFKTYLIFHPLLMHKYLGNYHYPHFFFLNESFFLSFFLWLCWVFVSVRGLSLVAASGGHSSSRCAGLSLSRPLLLWSTGSRRAGSVIVAHGLSCSAACGILPDQGSNPCPLHWQADSQPLCHQGSPIIPILTDEKTEAQLLLKDLPKIKQLVSDGTMSLIQLYLSTKLVPFLLRICRGYCRKWQGGRGIVSLRKQWVR